MFEQRSFPQDMLDDINEKVMWSSELKHAYVSYNEDMSMNVLSLVIKPSMGGENNFFHVEDLNHYVKTICDMLECSFTEVVFQIWSGKE